MADALESRDPNPQAVLHPDGRLNPNVQRAQYAVRGRIYLEAQKRLAKGLRVIFTNVGNPQALGQKPITFPRQVLALVNYPELLASPQAPALFPPDAIARAQRYLAALPGGTTGAYQDSLGNPMVREEVAAFIAQRDGHPCAASEVFLADGASPAIQKCLSLVIRNDHDGILLPVPQYPLYSASIAVLGGRAVGYELQEEGGWSLDMSRLARLVDDAKAEGTTVRGLVVINPGNPTGTLLSRENMEEIVRWCQRARILLLADEVYQSNVFGQRPFVAFRKVICDLGPAAREVECFSFHTVSKGVFGECGRRGGYVHLHNIHPRAAEQLYKLFSINLSSNVEGQLMVGLMCNPPKPGEPSYALFHQEEAAIAGSLKRRAILATAAFNAMPFVSCQRVEGALYAFPRIVLSERAVAKAEEQGVAPDLLYCLELLEETGICAVPGSGFGQKDGTFHLRTTILPPEDVFEEVLAKFRAFHEGFLLRYGTPATARL